MRQQAARTTIALLDDLLGDYRPRNFAVRLWDGTVWGPGADEEARFTILIREPGALRALLGPPSELALAEQYIHGAIEIEDDLEAVFPLADYLLVERRWTRRDRIRTLTRLLSLPSNGNGRRDGRQPARLRGRRFSLARDRQATTYHYDRSNDFFALWLDELMVYTTAYFASETDTLERAQLRKLDYVCRKLRLQPGERLLDIGCGWGALAIHAAERYGAEVVGITLSEAQAQVARKRIRERGLGPRCTIELRDYRELDEREAFDKIASIGMFEHVAEEVLVSYFRRAWQLLRPRGVFLNHGIARPIDQPQRRGGSFMLSYVYPDAELSPISTALRAAELAGFEVRDVESLREHYPPTLREWLRRLEANREAAIRASDDVTYRIFRIYLAGSIYGFSTGRVNVYQSLLAKPRHGESALPLTREDWYR
jgi:cyclopropane-fatty-acyl-phospholipid synthase